MDRKVIALGFFDGVHLAHGALLQKTVERANELHCTSAAFTFASSPKEFVTGVPVPLLTDAQERRELIETLYGVEQVIIAPFDRAMMTMPWQDFLAQLLVGQHHAVHLIAGHDYRFGYKNEGDVERLRAYCAAHGLGCDIIPKVEREGITVSSTYIRGLVERGEIARAAEFLGHPYAMTGVVEHGQGLGSSRLFPTANLIPSASRILPLGGVYATRVRLPDGAEYPGVTNVGTRPTVSAQGSVSVETNLIGFSGDLYGKTIRVEFRRYLRAERRFASTQELHDQIAQDIARTKELLK